MDFWDRIAGVYDLAETVNGKVYREMCNITRRLTPDGAKVLDCAAGTGELTFAAAEKADSVLCTDLSENMLKTARKKAKLSGADNVSFEARTMFHLRRGTFLTCKTRTKPTISSLPGMFCTCWQIRRAR